MASLTQLKQSLFHVIGKVKGENIGKGYIVQFSQSVIIIMKAVLKSFLNIVIDCFALMANACITYSVWIAETSNAYIAATCGYDFSLALAVEK